ncbi:MAG: hypothetical protein IJT94_10895 [Oscillibacter sp.]|nr:hypothetical protein [Oscillibacter sp.]
MIDSGERTGTEFGGKETGLRPCERKRQYRTDTAAKRGLKKKPRGEANAEPPPSG